MPEQPRDHRHDLPVILMCWVAPAVTTAAVLTLFGWWVVAIFQGVNDVPALVLMVVLAPVMFLFWVGRHVTGTLLAELDTARERARKP